MRVAQTANGSIFTQKLKGEAIEEVRGYGIYRKLSSVVQESEGEPAEEDPWISELDEALKQSPKLDTKIVEVEKVGRVIQGNV